MKSLKITLAIFTGAALMMLSACGKKESAPIDQFCWEQISQYTVTEIPPENTDPTDPFSENYVSVTLTAPDYFSLLTELAKEDSAKEITSDMLAKAIKNHPDAVKEYTFTASSSDEANIRNGFFDAIAHDLAVEAITNTEYTEKWSVEE